MASFISKSLFTATVTAPTFLSLGLIGIIKDSMNYFQLWGSMLKKHEIPTNFEWWSINFSLIFMLICFIGIKIFFYNKSNKHEEGKTIRVQSYSNLSQNSAEQVISSIIPWLTIFADKLDGALTIVAALFGGGILNLVLGLLFTFIGIAIYSAIFSWVANKFDANTTYESVLKIMWYEQAYNQIMGLVYFIGLILVSVPFFVILGFNLNSTVNSIVWLTIVIFTLIAFSVFIFWVWLTLLSHQINKSRLATFGISIITSLIPVVFIGILVGMVMLATSR